jgi:hypothetical protein
MGRFGTRTSRYLAVLWLGAAVLEAGVLVMADRTNNSWFLLLALLVLVIPIAATERTFNWFGRAPRKRWKIHDVEDGLLVPPDPPAQSTRVPPPPAA